MDDREIKIRSHLFSLHFFLPILIWNPVNNNLIYQAFKPIPEEIQNISSIINKKTEKGDIILASNEISPWILLLTGRHLALSGSPWCSNPTARYSLRYNDFKKAFLSNDINEVKEILNKWDVGILIFSKQNDDWYFNAASPEYGRLHAYRDLNLKIDKRIFRDSNNFNKMYEDENYIIIKVKI